MYLFTSNLQFFKKFYTKHKKNRNISGKTGQDESEEDDEEEDDDNDNDDNDDSVSHDEEDDAEMDGMNLN